MDEKKKRNVSSARSGEYGEGSVYQRKGDGRWVASVPLGSGKKKQRYFDTEKEAERARRRMLQEREQGKLVAGRDQLLKSYLDYWLDIQQTALRPGTYSLYHRYLTKIIVPALGHVRLQKLTGDMFQSLYARLQREGMAANTVRTIHTIVRKALEDAVRTKKLPFNPVKDARPPRKSESEMNVLNVEQAKKLLAYARDGKLDCLLKMSLLGLRRGELLGLKWQDVDFEKGELKVQRTLSYIHNPQTGHHEFIEGKPKTKSSGRAINLPGFVLDALKEHQIFQQYRQSFSYHWEHKDLIFCTEKGGYIAPTNLRVQFKALLEKAGLPDIRFHDLRHSAATIWLAMGVNPKVIQELLGHSNINVTLNVYSHVLPTMHKDVALDLDKLFKREDE